MFERWKVALLTTIHRSSQHGTLVFHKHQTGWKKNTNSRWQNVWVCFYIYQGCSCVLTCSPLPHLLLHTLGHTPSQVSPSFFSHTHGCKNKTRAWFSIIQTKQCSRHVKFILGGWLIHNNKALNCLTSDGGSSGDNSAFVVLPLQKNLNVLDLTSNQNKEAWKVGFLHNLHIYC